MSANSEVRLHHNHVVAAHATIIKRVTAFIGIALTAMSFLPILRVSIVTTDASYRDEVETEPTFFELPAERSPVAATKLRHGPWKIHRM
jgi:hypothetical protein